MLKDNNNDLWKRERERACESHVCMKFRNYYLFIYYWEMFCVSQN